MFFSLEHITEYDFTGPVFLEPHHLRFCPRNDGYQRVLRYELEIEPKPAGITDCLDANGNQVSVAWFNGIHNRMLLRSVLEVETLRKNPYDFVLPSQNQRLPILYQPWEVAQLAASLRREAIPLHVDPARELGEQLREASRSEVMPFVTRLTETIARRFTVIYREQG